MAIDMTALQNKVQANSAAVKQTVTKEVETIKETNYIKALEVDNKNYQAKFLQMTAELADNHKLLLEAMKMIENNNKLTEEAIRKEVMGFKGSNETVARVMQDEGKKITNLSTKTITDLGDTASKGIKQSLTETDEAMQKAVKSMKSIVTDVGGLYSNSKLILIPIAILLWVNLMSALYTLQGVFKIDSLGSWIKVLSGWALF